MTTNINIPYLEDTGLDGKKLYTPKEWTERLRHYIKRTHDIDIKPILTDGTTPTHADWNTKEPAIRQDIIWGAGPTAIEDITKGQFNTDPDTITAERLLKLFMDHFLPKRNTYHSRGDFFWAKQEENETPLEHWRKLITLERNCEFKDIKQEDLIISKFITSITDKKLRKKLIGEKTLNLQTTMELITQDSYDKRNKVSAIPATIAKDKKQYEAIQKLFRNQKPLNKTRSSDCGFRRQQNWTPRTQMPS